MGFSLATNQSYFCGSNLNRKCNISKEYGELGNWRMRGVFTFCLHQNGVDLLFCGVIVSFFLYEFSVIVKLECFCQ